MNEATLWERHARWWQERFTEGADAEYEEQILPIVAVELAGSSRVLEVGSGEGQVARTAARGGAAVVGVDIAWSQLSAARRRGGGPLYVRGTASALALRRASFDAAVVCLVLEHVSGLDDAVSELSRVLTGGGKLILLLNHPLLQTPGSGWIDDRILEEQYWRIGPYLEEDTTLEEVDPGVRLPFMHRPLSRYFNLLADHGLVVTRMQEPPPPPGFLARAEEYEAAATIPRLLALTARKLPLPGGDPGSSRSGRPQWSPP